MRKLSPRPVTAPLSPRPKIQDLKIYAFGGDSGRLGNAGAGGTGGQDNGEARSEQVIGEVRFVKGATQTVYLDGER